MAFMERLKKILRKVHAPKDYSGGIVKDSGTRQEIARAKGAGAAANGSASGIGG